ncbi:CS domain protein [Reticulomyxa filosa]|uniref:CS domain protein n=1 Tax=Reticulomyxa filosa TaxID=46433 RepID=X6P207_RETFI|nr:CS domain protein [Reticulomyxa filosa]|eukprot:ETO32580.1 CS domain protein [Reticulomyxa filosa]
MSTEKSGFSFVAIEFDNKFYYVFNPKRKRFIHDGKVIYEWEQSLEDVLIYIQLPKDVNSKQLKIEIKSDSISVGLKNVAKPYLKEELASTINKADSVWSVSDGQLEINLSKQTIGETWSCVFKRHAEQQLNVTEAENTKKQMLLERFQRENPHMDFSQAQFNGTAPDPTTFLDGIDKEKLQ